ncbi:MAG: hypothetical protein WCA58_02365 [Terriglobales bacterium]
MFKGAFVVLLMLGIAAIVWGQSSADLSAKYRQITSYELRPDVVMTPKYAADGQVCEMILEKRQKTDNGMIFGVSFSEKEVKGLVDELVPEAERGRDLTKPLNTTVDGGFITTEYNYENVHVRVYGITRPAPAGDRVITITWPKRTCSGGQNSATAETVDPKTGNVHLTIPVVAKNKPKQ